METIDLTKASLLRRMRPVRAVFCRGGALETKKLVSLVTAGCFLLTAVLGQAGAAVAEMRREGAPLNNVFEGFALPYTAGRVTDAWYCGSKDVVINIQDLHCHPEVQKNIARILAMLDKKYKLPKVYLEGAVGSVDTSLLNAVEDGRIRQGVISALLEKGQLTGAEYYSLNSRRFDVIQGLENGALYRQNALRLKNILDEKNDLQALLGDLRADLDELKDTCYGPRNKRLERLLSSYKGGQSDSRKYFNFLIKHAERARIDTCGYRNIVRYRQLIGQEKALNYRRIAGELQRYMLALKQQLPYSAFSALMEQTKDFSQLDELYLSLSRMPGAFSPGLARSFPHLNGFFEYIRESQKINPLSLVSEEKKLLREIQERSSESASEREIVFLRDYFRSLEDYANNNISSDDYDYFTARRDEFRLLLGKYTDNTTLTDLEPYGKVLDDYYRVNRERNDWFLKNILGESAARPARDASGGNDDAAKVFSSLREGGRLIVTVTGGFHTPGVTELLRGRKVSYVVITPNVTQDTRPSDAAYTRLIYQQSKVLSQTFAALILAQYPLHPAARRYAAAAFAALAGKAPGERELAAVRDEINAKVFGPLQEKY
ncbi:MAG: hypothetical protein ACYC5N_01995, partial [Endomicrobiales bacterium]